MVVWRFWVVKRGQTPYFIIKGVLDWAYVGLGVDMGWVRFGLDWNFWVK